MSNLYPAIATRYLSDMLAMIKAKLNAAECQTHDNIDLVIDCAQRSSLYELQQLRKHAPHDRRPVYNVAYEIRKIFGGRAFI